MEVLKDLEAQQKVVVLDTASSKSVSEGKGISFPLPQMTVKDQPLLAKFLGKPIRGSSCE
jgi:hypothetical protein